MYYTSKIKSSRFLFLLDLVITDLYHTLPFLDWSVTVCPLLSSKISICCFFYLNLTIAMKSIQNVQLGPILGNFALYHQSSSLSFVCCSDKGSRERQRRKPTQCPLKRTWRQVSPSEHKGYELTSSYSVSAVWWGGASYLLVCISIPRSRGFGALWPCCCDWQTGWNSFFERLNCVQSPWYCSFSFSPTSVALCDQQFLLFRKNYYFGLLLQFFCSPKGSSFN